MSNNPQTQSQYNKQQTGGNPKDTTSNTYMNQSNPQYSTNNPQNTDWNKSPTYGSQQNQPQYSSTQQGTYSDPNQGQSGYNQQGSTLNKQPTTGGSQYNPNTQYQYQGTGQQPMYNDPQNKGQNVGYQPGYQQGYQQSTGSTQYQNQPQMSSYGQQQKDQYTKKQTNYFGTALNIDPNQYIFACDEAEVNEIYDAFQRGGVVVLPEFLDSLKTTGLGNTCTVLGERINDWITANRSNEANQETFKNFFKFDMTQDSDFRYIYRMLDENKSGSIGKGELYQINKTHELGLTQDDLRLMIDNLKRTNPDSVTRDELFNALYANAKSK